MPFRIDDFRSRAVPTIGNRFLGEQDADLRMRLDCFRFHVRDDVAAARVDGLMLAEYVGEGRAFPQMQSPRTPRSVDNLFAQVVETACASTVLDLHDH